MRLISVAGAENIFEFRTGSDMGRARQEIGFHCMRPRGRRWVCCGAISTFNFSQDLTVRARRRFVRLSRASNPTVAILERLGRALEVHIAEFFDEKRVARAPVKSMPSSRRRQ